MELLINSAFLVSAIGFILGLKLMGKPSQAKLGNSIAALGMIIAIATTAFMVIGGAPKITNIIFLFSALTAGTLIGRYMAFNAEMTGMPQLVSLFNAFGGASAVLISINEAVIQTEQTPLINFLLVVGAVLGGMSFTGSIIAYFKLEKNVNISNLKLIKFLSLFIFVIIIVSLLMYFSVRFNGLSFLIFICAMSMLSLIYGVVFTIPIGGADMPVLVSFLNAITGVATAFSGLAFNSPIMLIGGILVGATGVFLTFQMCSAMNRSLRVVLAGKIKSAGSSSSSEMEIQTITPVETASLLAFSNKIAIIPGYGMAVAQAQQACFELQKNLMAKGASVTYIIHPVAGRMPGHMNVLLAEAKVEYHMIKDMDEVNDTMEQFDICIVIGANDVVNPAAEDDPESVIYGMPIIKAYLSNQVIVMKRGMAAGYSGAENPLLGRQNCKLLFGDAKESLSRILDEIKRI